MFMFYFDFYRFCVIYFFHFLSFFFFFFFNDTATTEIYTLSLHDALPISNATPSGPETGPERSTWCLRSEEHTSELQSLAYLVCRLLLEKKKQNTSQISAPAVADNDTIVRLQYAMV